MKTRPEIYLDYAAATPVDPAVSKAILPYLSDNYFNPSATYNRARQARADINDAKSRIAAILGVKSSELILTSGGTEANNLAIKGTMSQYPGKVIAVSGVEHESVLEPADSYANKILSVDETGTLDLNQVVKSIDDETVLVSVMLANNEVGSIQPVKKLAARLETIRKDRKARAVTTPLIFHTDACQAPQYLDVHPHRLGVDLMTLNAGKIHGPKQSGVLYVRSGIRLSPQILGGGQQRGIRSGTESPAAAIGMAEALHIVSTKRVEESQRMKDLQVYFLLGLQKLDPEIIINGPTKNRLPNNVHATFIGADNERLIYQLDELGVMAAAGSACSAERDDASHVLRAMGVSSEHARSSLRFTMGRLTTQKDIDYTLGVLASLLS